MNTFPLSNLLLLDIETVPCYERFEMLPDELKLLWGDKISKTVPESLTLDESYLLRAGIMAEFGKIICISAGYFYEDESNQVCFKVKSICCEEEAEILQNFLKITDVFFKTKKHIVFGGHNIREFDIPYICRRLLINNIPLPPYLQLHAAKPWEIEMIDTLQWWKFGDYKNYISLNLLATILNVPSSKGDIDGSKVRDVYYEHKDIQRIATYCEKDVIVVANIILRFKNQPLLKEENIQIIK
ncbi:ribonuclease H-like domain-containing protein [Parafilimonas sp.]|uniref:ribonuclease H-like domain-containing protein n=1 Tax=Parafilimonas sp. TaxID=1969739 RepID=UPI003F7F6DEF